jgi:hypothetical protein
MGKLPKINFPKFQDANPKLWVFRCESHFDMYDVDPIVWVKVASMHFEGHVARWLHSRLITVFESNLTGHRPTKLAIVRTMPD